MHQAFSLIFSFPVLLLTLSCLINTTQNSTELYVKPADGQFFRALPPDSNTDTVKAQYFNLALVLERGEHFNITVHTEITR